MGVLVFKYTVNDLLAVAVVPSDRSTIHFCGRSRVVHTSIDDLKHSFVIDPADRVYHFDDVAEGLATATALHEELCKVGSISPTIFPEAVRPAPIPMSGRTPRR